MFCLHHDWGFGWMHKRQQCDFIRRLSIQKMNLQSLGKFQNIGQCLKISENKRQLIIGFDKKLYRRVLKQQRYPQYQDILNLSQQIIRKIHGANNQSKKNWTAQQTLILFWIIRLFSNIFHRQIETFNFSDWDQISDYIPGRIGRQCMFRYLRLTKILLAQNPWTEREHQVFVQLMSQIHSINWNLISEQIYLRCQGNCVYRFPKQCKQYWSTHINRQYNKGSWSQNQDTTLLNQILHKGRQWSQYVQQLPGRSINAIKNRANLLTNKNIKKFKPSKRNAQFIELLETVKRKLTHPEQFNIQLQKDPLKPSEKISNNFTKTLQSNQIVDFQSEQNLLNTSHSNLQNNQQIIVAQQKKTNSINQVKQINLKNTNCEFEPELDVEPMMLTNYLKILSQTPFSLSSQNYLNLNQIEILFQKPIEDDLQVFYSE